MLVSSFRERGLAETRFAQSYRSTRPGRRGVRQVLRIACWTGAHEKGRALKDPVPVGYGYYRVSVSSITTILEGRGRSLSCSRAGTLPLQERFHYSILGSHLPSPEEAPQFLPDCPEYLEQEIFPQSCSLGLAVD